MEGKGRVFLEVRKCIFGNPNIECAFMSANHASRVEKARLLDIRYCSVSSTAHITRLAGHLIGDSSMPGHK